MLTTTISIHAPTKGATISAVQLHVCLRYFNPRTHEGCDVLCHLMVSIFVLFQSTHPRRVRHFGRSGSLVSPDFNPRTHEGCDVMTVIQCTMTCPFQSTHPRRVRPCSIRQWPGCGQFQSTHPRRVRHYKK